MSIQKPSILVAEDDPMLLKSLNKYLERKGYSTFPASDGLQAVEFFKKKQPSVVLTDYAMPNLSGGRLIEKIRELDCTVPILLMTGELSDTVILDLLRFDRLAAIHKPFQPKDILTGLDRVFSLKALCENATGRRANRVNVEVPLSFGPLDRAKTLNISSFGMFVKTDKVVHIGEHLKINIDLPKPVQVIGEVVWTREPNSKLPTGIGIRFLQFKADAELEIRDLLMNELKKINRGWISFSSCVLENHGR